MVVPLLSKKIIKKRVKKFKRHESDCYVSLKVSRNIDLVYGGGSIGLMGLVSQVVHDGGRHVIGVIPKTLMPREVGLLNVDGYYNSLLSFIDKAVDEGFVSPMLAKSFYLHLQQRS